MRASDQTAICEDALKTVSFVDGIAAPPMPIYGRWNMDSRGPAVQGILVVDDDAAVRDALVMLLSDEGYEARGAHDGVEALRVLRNGFRASLVVLDMMMPKMDGWDFRLAQRRDPELADIPIVVLTAIVDPAVETKKLDAVAGFRKPLDSYALLQVVSELLSSVEMKSTRSRTGRARRHGGPR